MFLLILIGKFLALFVVIIFGFNLIMWIIDQLYWRFEEKTRQLLLSHKVHYSLLGVWALFWVCVSFLLNWW